MFGSVKKIFGQDEKSKILKEYVSIVDLENKRTKLEIKYGTRNEDVQTQENILMNNLKVLGKLYTDLEIPALTKNYSGNFEYFNMQGTPANVIKMDEAPASITYKLGKEVIDITIQTPYYEDVVPKIISLQKKFLDLNKSKFNKKFYDALISKININIENIISDYSKNFKGNEELVKEFILKNLQGLEYTDNISIQSIIDRLILVRALTNTTLFLMYNSENFDIGHKNIIVIDTQLFNTYEMELEKFINNFKQNRYDFIIKGR